MDRILRTGIIGTGGISRVHLDALKNFDGAKIVAVCDTRRDRLEKAAQETGADMYSDYKELLAREDIDVVHILTPHYLHAPMAIDALNAGKHVLTEKPMATSTEDARRMIECAKTAKGTLSVIFQNRYNPSTVELKKRIDSGETGALKCARVSVCWHREREYYTESGWRGFFKTEGGGVLINQSIHSLDLLSYLGGRINRVKGHVSTDLLSDYIEVEDNCHAVFEYDNGAIGVLHATTNYGIDAPIVLEMVFENGTYQIVAEKLFKIEDGIPNLLVSGDAAKNLGVKSYWGASHKIEIEKLYNAIANGERFEIDGVSAFPALNFVTAIYESSAKNDWVELERI